MLDILAMLSHDGGTELCKALAQLGDNLRSYKILDCLLAAVFRIDIYIKLYRR